MNRVVCSFRPPFRILGQGDHPKGDPAEADSPFAFLRPK